MVNRVQIKRTSTNNSPPANNTLEPGELAVEMNTPARLWVGVPTSIDSSGRILISQPSHSHVVADVTGLQTALDGKQPLDSDLTSIASLTGDGRLTKFAGGWFMDTTAYAAASHSHAIADVTNLQTTLDGKQPLDADLTSIAGLAGTTGLLKKTAANTWSLDTTAYLTSSSIGSTVQAYNAGLAEIASISTDGTLVRIGGGWATSTQIFAPLSHTHSQSDITNLTTDLAAKAPLASPALTGTPTAPTAAATVDNTQIATTAFAQAMRRQIVRNTQTGTTYTPVAADAGKAITLSNASAITCTIPNSVFAAGDRVDFIQYGAGQVTFAAGSGFTLRSSGSKLKLSGQYSGATVYFLSASEGILIGDITT